MTVFLNLVILLLVAARILVGVGIEFLQILTKYDSLAGLLIPLLFVIKYLIYGIPRFRDIRYYAEDAKPMDYALLPVYPICDIIRSLLVFGIVSAMVHRLYMESPVINLYIDSILYLVMIVIAFFIDYFCKDAETIWSNLIVTAVFTTVVLVFSKGIVLNGLFLYLS